MKRQLGGVSFVRMHGKRAEHVEPPKVGEPEPLEAFENRILRALAE